MTIKEKFIDLHVEVAWDIIRNDELTNNEKVRLLNNIIKDEINGGD
jgi:hypothetical protein